MRITGIENIKTLYKEGKISRASYYRGIKRGWVEVNYHQPHKKGEALWFRDESLTLYVYEALIKIARANRYNVEFDPRDLAHEAFLYLVDRGEPLTNKLFATAKSYINALQRNRGSAKYSSSKEVSGAGQDLLDFVTEHVV